MEGSGKKPFREQLRDNPGAMWIGLDARHFHGGVAESKRPKTYRMEIASGFNKTENGTRINLIFWHNAFQAVHGNAAAGFAETQEDAEEGRNDSKNI